MDMFTATTKILAVQRFAERQRGSLFNARSRQQIEHCTGHLLEVIAKGGSREQLAETMRWMRAASEWPGDLQGWTWFDDKLFTLVQYLEQEETFPSQAELVEELERACKAGVIR
jgi:hypothetical protein